MATLQLQQFGRTARTPRRPSHSFAMMVKPWQVAPFFIAPVLPGETMKNLLMQARVVSDPVGNPLIGWWCEFYFWYVKHRDLNERDTLTQMMIEPSVTAPLTPAGDGPYHCFPNGVNYAKMCLRRCVEKYFRDEGEAWDMALIGNYPAAQINQRTMLDSALLETAYTAGAPGLVVGADDTITGQEIDATWLLWQQYRASNITNLSYEEYLATYGIPIPQGSDSEHRPELIRYVKEWSYPTNTVDPSTGTPTSALSWAIAERADKDRFFREPGFLFGAVCVRPKCYLRNQTGSGVGALKDALSWLPAVMGDNPSYSVRSFAGLTGPYQYTTNAYRIDLKDLFLYGDQWNGMGVSPPYVANTVALPTAGFSTKYPTATDAEAMFKTGTTNFIRMDGVVSLNILGMQTDTTPTMAPGTF